MNNENYLNMLYKKYPSFDSNSDNNIQKGGAKKKLNKKTKTRKLSRTEKYNYEPEITIIEKGSVPFGGFPLIYLCDNVNQQTINPSKNREYSRLQSSISIKDIMQKRREVTPFMTGP